LVIADIRILNEDAEQKIQSVNICMSSGWIGYLLPGSG
jgi:hypothetical protein